MKTIKKYSINDFFNLGIYKESFRQLALVATVCFIIINLISVLVPLGNYISIESAANSNNYQGYSVTNYSTAYIVTAPTTVYSAIKYCHQLYIIPLVIAPLLTLITFNFLTKRTCSDYFHAFPQKRSCIFLSKIAAILSWLLILIVGTSAITSFAYFCFSKYFMFTHIILWQMSVSIFISSALVVAGVAISCSLTGTIFTNIITSLIILFFPRLLLFLVESCLTLSSDLFVAGKVSPLLNATSNLLIACIFKNEVSILNIFPTLYTIILTVIYLFIATWLFTKRSSEVAGTSAINRTLQCIFRLCVGLPLSLLVIYNIIEAITIGRLDTLNAEVIFYMIAAEIVCIIGMLIFELISTRKFRCVLKSLPSILLFFGAQILIFTFSLTFYFVEENYTPKEEDIDYIVPYDVTLMDDYYIKQLSYCKIDNTEINEIISESLKNTVADIKKHREEHVNGYSINHFHDKTRVIVGINSGLTTKYRYVYMTSTDYEKFMTLLMESEEFLKVYSSLPKYNKLMSKTYIQGLSENQSLKLYNILVEELKDLSPKELYNTLYKEDSAIYFGFTTYVNSNYVYTRIPITSYTPKAMLYYLNQFSADALKCTEAELDSILSASDAQEYMNKTEITLLRFNRSLTHYNCLAPKNYMSESDDIDSRCNDQKAFIKDIHKNNLEEFTTLDMPEGKSLIRINFINETNDKSFNCFTFVDDEILDRFGLLD